MKVLYCSEGYTTHDRRFLTSLASAGCEVCFLQLTDRVYELAPLPAGITTSPWDPVPPSSLDWETCGGLAPGFRRVWDRERPDVALAGPIQTGTLIAALSKCRPYVAMSWGSDLLVEAEKSLEMRTRTRQALAPASGGLGDCEAVRAAFSRHCALPPENLVTFPWGIDLQKFPPAKAENLLPRSARSQDEVVFVSSRSWEPIHAVDLLVKAFAEVRAEHPRVRLVLLGDGGQKLVIERVIAELGLRECVFAPGRVSNDCLLEHFSASDVYVSATVSDGSSISLLEAMACELPVVVTDAHGNKEWVCEGVNGWLAAPGDVESLAGALRTALASRAMYPEIGHRNRKAVKSRADWRKNSRFLIRLLRRVAGGADERRR